MKRPVDAADPSCTRTPAPGPRLALFTGEPVAYGDVGLWVAEAGLLAVVIWTRAQYDALPVSERPRDAQWFPGARVWAALRPAEV